MYTWEKVIYLAIHKVILMPYRLISLSLLFVFSFFSAHAELADTVEKIKPSVVGIGVYTPTSRPKNILRGSGFVIGNGRYVVTNNHVLPDELDENLHYSYRRW